MTPTRILVANDQEWAARAVETILTGAGYQVRRAHTGTQAIEQAEQFRPDACFLDVQMPGLSGVEVAARLAAADMLGPLVPLILTTAGPAGRGLRLAAATAGAWDFLTQPIDGPLLLAKLDLFLRIRRSALPVPTIGADASDDVPRLLRQIEDLVGAARRADRLAVTLLIHPKEAGELALAAAAAEDERDAAATAALAIRRTSRAGDLVGSLGPSRFVVVAVGIKPAEIERLQQRYARSVEAASAGSGLTDQWTVTVVDDLQALVVAAGRSGVALPAWQRPT